MKNVTITLEEDVANWARVWAAKQGSSLSRLVGLLLRERMLEEKGYKVAMAEYLSAEPVKLERSGPYPSRDALHDRAGLR